MILIFFLSSHQVDVFLLILFSINTIEICCSGKGVNFFKSFFLFYFLLKWMSIIDPYLISINTIEIPCSWRMGLIDAVWHGTTCPRLIAGQISKMRTRTCCKIKILNMKIGKQSEARGFNPVAVFYLCLIWSQVPVFG